MRRPLDADRLRQALEALGADLAARGVFVEFAVYGGGALIPAARTRFPSVVASPQ